MDSLTFFDTLEQFPEDGVKYQVRFSLFKDEAMICLDSSGEGLYKRGYRAVGVEAPLRETLAGVDYRYDPVYHQFIPITSKEV